MKTWAFIVLVFVVLAVKRHEFKTCKDLGFCVRNRALARNPAYKISYSIVPESVVKAASGITFKVKSDQESSPFLTGEAYYLSNDVLRFYLNEISPLHKRYHTPDDMILNLENIHRKDVTQLTSTQAVWAYGDYKYILTYSPISIQGFYKGSLIYHVNERSLLNFERYRTRETTLSHNNYNILDATGVPGDYPLWEERWRDFTDNNPRGPSSIGLDITFAKTLDIYGIPEHADSLSLIDTENSEPYRLYNLDVFEYELNERMTLYGNIPFILNKNGGLFWNNPSETWVDVQSSAYNGDSSKRIHWFSETGVLDIFLFLAANPMNLVQTFTRLTGPPSLPPLFSIAYHQCRWNYFTQKEVKEIEQGFEDHDIPMDVIWLDIEHTPNRMYFIWDYSSFPEPIKMINELVEHGRKLVTIVDPHMSKRKNFSVGQGFKDKGKKLYRVLCEK